MSKKNVPENNKEQASLEKLEAAMLQDIKSSLEDFNSDRSNLIPILQMIQNNHSYLDPGAIDLVAGHLDLTACDVYGVATFYNQFRFNPPGKHQLKVCTGTACHVRGADVILESFERKLGVKAGETTEDREFSIEKVACVGCCALAPVAVVDEDVHANVMPSRVEGIFLGFELEKEKKAREEGKEKEAGSGE